MVPYSAVSPTSQSNIHRHHPTAESDSVVLHKTQSFFQNIALSNFAMSSDLQTRNVGAETNSAVLPTLQSLLNCFIWLALMRRHTIRPVYVDILPWYKPTLIFIVTPSPTLLNQPTCTFWPSCVYPSYCEYWSPKRLNTVRRELAQHDFCLGWLEKIWYSSGQVWWCTDTFPATLHQQYTGFSYLSLG